MDFKKAVIEILSKEIEVDESLIAIPPDQKLGDFTYPVFQLAKEKKKGPKEMAEELIKKLQPVQPIKEIRVVGPYINFFIDKVQLAKTVLTKITDQKNDYGKSDIGNKKTVVIDFSSPNIAKSFGIAHIRSTVIGNSLSRIFKNLGYKVERVNHLGDWGTQFGKLIVAYKEWGDEKKLEKEGISHLVSIYIKFQEEAKIDPELEDQAREWFAKLEKGDKQALDLWELFREISMEEFKRYYSVLDIEFDHYTGESFYIKYLEKTIQTVKDKVKTEKSEGALIVNLEEWDMAPFMLLKADGSTIYHTRDMAAALYRLEKFKPHKVLYIVDKRQKNHFKQVFKVLELMKEPADKFIHVDFGMMSYEGAAMSTREGNFVLLEEVLDKAIELALKTIEEKNPNLKNKKEVAQIVGIGAVVFGDLSNDRVKDVDFRWDKVLDFEGDTAPYIQYVHARICSIIRKNDNNVPKKINFGLLNEDIEARLIKMLKEFPEIIEKISQSYKPSSLCRYLLDLCQEFNSFYNTCPILNSEEEIKNARIYLIDSVRQVLENGLYLLGIKAPDEM